MSLSVSPLPVPPLDVIGLLKLVKTTAIWPCPPTVAALRANLGVRVETLERHSTAEYQ